MSTQEDSRQHREARHREDKPSKRRHPHGKRHQSADADSRPITEADLDSEASSLQDDDDLVESLSRSSSRRTASSRKPVSPADSRRSASSYPHYNQGTLASKPSSVCTQSHPAGLPTSGSSSPDSGKPAGFVRSESPLHGGTPGSQGLGPPLLDKSHFNVGGLDVSPHHRSTSLSAGRSYAGGHMDYYSRADCLLGSQSV